jgi:hypothetical protein
MDLGAGGDKVVSNELVGNSWVGNGVEDGIRKRYQAGMVEGVARRGSTADNVGHGRKRAQKRGGSRTPTLEDPYPPEANG